MSTAHKDISSTDPFSRIQEKWGEQALKSLRELSGLKVIATGDSLLDDTLSIGGIPCGHLTEFAGRPTSGATTLTYRIIASAQASQQKTIYIDLAHQFDATYATSCGSNLESLLLLHPPNIKNALEAAHDLLLAGNLNLLVLDTGSDRRMEAVSRDLLLRLAAPLRRSSCAFLWLATAPTPPAPVREQAALRLRFKHMAWQYQDGEVCGYHCEVTVLKNRFAPGERRVVLDILLED